MIKRISIAAAILIFTAAISLYWAAGLFLSDRYKPIIEKSVSAATGKEFVINGKIRLSFFPSIRFSLNDIYLKEGGIDIFSAQSVNVSPFVLPLLRRRLLIKGIEIDSPVILITRDMDGSFNIQPPKRGSKGEETIKKDTKSVINHLALKRFTVSDGEISYSDRTTGFKTSIKGFKLKMKDFISVADVSGEDGNIINILKNISFHGYLRAEKIKINSIDASNIKMEFREKQGMMEADKVSLDIYGSEGSGTIHVDMRAETPLMRVDWGMNDIEANNLFSGTKYGKAINGKINFSTKLEVPLLPTKRIMGMINGSISASGKDIVLKGYDMDGILEGYEKTQKINLYDIGAFVAAGPIGTIFTKTFDAAAVYNKLGRGKTLISEFRSDWEIRDGIAKTKDVAMATKRNRIALRGSVDIGNREFRNLSIALVDKKGCVRYSQTITGRFDRPSLGKTVIATKTILGPVLSIFRQTRSLLNNLQCRIFYDGSIAAPSGL